MKHSSHLLTSAFVGRDCDYDRKTDEVSLQQDGDEGGDGRRKYHGCIVDGDQLTCDLFFFARVIECF